MGAHLVRSEIFPLLTERRFEKVLGGGLKGITS